jgi:D-tagatose-1,6-bisphosphate aldolase subunit GatZ/KbaZ
MYLDDIVAAQAHGGARGIASICSAHPWVLRAAMQAVLDEPDSTEVLLVEATCNQVNQFGGYTGMRPQDFVAYVRDLAGQQAFPLPRMRLGGDHLGPSVWQDEPAETAMGKSMVLVQEYVGAGFTKLHIDASMPLGDDPAGAPEVEVSARRAALLVETAERAAEDARQLRYVIGTEVPPPGGAQEHEKHVNVTPVARAQETIEVTRAAFQRQGLSAAWERVVALVVQPGVEFGDDFVLAYRSEAAQALSSFIEGFPMVFEAHSTDYQSQGALRELVRDHFAILKVGPALTFAFREAAFALAMIEERLLPADPNPDLITTLEQVMLARPEHWRRYYHGSQQEQAFKRKYSLSDRIRYYWTDPQVQQALQAMLARLVQVPIPPGILRQFVPDVIADLEAGWGSITPEQILLGKVRRVLADYLAACKGE